MAVILSAHHIAPQSGGFEPQRANNFAIEFYGLPGAETLDLALASGFTPNSTSGVVTVPFQGENRKVAGRGTFGPGTIAYNDYVDAPVEAILLAWRDLVYDPRTGAVGLASSYKRQAAILLFDPAGGSVRVYDLEGVWPVSVTGSGLAMNQEAQRSVSMSLQFDRAIPAF